MIKYQLEHKRAFLIGMIIITLSSFLLGITLQQNSSLDALIPQDGSFNTNEELVRKAFNSGDPLLIIMKLDDKTILSNAVTTITDERVIEYSEELKNILRESQYIESISELEISKENNIAKITLFAKTPETLTGDKEVKEEIEFLISQVGKPTGLEVELTGLPLLINRISTLLIQDNLITIILTTLFITAFLFTYFRSIKFVLAIVISPIISLIILAAAMVAMDISITISLAAVGVLVLGLGVDYSIHIAIHYKYERLNGKNHKKAMLAVFDELRIPITASFLTTLAGFAALMFGVSPSSQDQGFVLSAAIAIIYAVSFAFFPILLTYLVKDAKLQHNKFYEKIKLGLAKLAIYQSRRPKTILTIFGIITIFMFYGMSQVQFSTSNSNWIPENDPLSIAFREESYAFGQQDTLFVILKSTDLDLRNTQTIKDIKQLERDLRLIPNIDSVSSVFTNSPESRSEAYEYLTNNPQAFNEGYTVSLIAISSSNLDDVNGNSRVLKDIRETVNRNPIYYADTEVFGDVVRFEELGTSLQQDAAKTTIIGLGLVFIIASSIYASIAVGLIALIPIMIGLVWAIGLMGFLGVPFTSLSTGIVSLVLGIGIDFSIHLVDGIKRHLKKFNLEKSIEKTLVSSGTSILLSSLTTFFGFIALTFSQLLGTQRLGWSLAIAVISVFFVAILTIPAILKLTKVKK